ncbi:MAG: hypothetical protein WA254_01675 [Candidatus Sulfotelmatobacter sp.]|jgi:hypothetical protein
MPRHLILDTNIFYDLGAGSLTPSDVGDADEILWYSPLSVLELAGKWSSRTFLARKAAANAILISGAKELPDQDTYLTRDLFGYALKRPPVALTDAVKAMADSHEMDALVSGVLDFAERVVRRVSVAKVQKWRDVIEGKWVDDMLSIQRREIPRFEAWHKSDPATRKQRVPRLRGLEKETFLDSTKNPAWNLTLVFNLHHRALMGARRVASPAVPPTEAASTVDKAITSLSCYCAVYTQYLIRLLIDGALAEPNDSGDLELFIYATDDDHIVVTSDKKWKRIADAAGFGNRVRLVS